MPGSIGKKIGMTSVFSADGKKGNFTSEQLQRYVEITKKLTEAMK